MSNTRKSPLSLENKLTKDHKDELGQPDRTREGKWSKVSTPPLATRNFQIRMQTKEGEALGLPNTTSPWQCQQWGPLLPSQPSSLIQCFHINQVQVALGFPHRARIHHKIIISTTYILLHPFLIDEF